MEHDWRGRRVEAAAAKVRSTWLNGIISARSTRSPPRRPGKRQLEGLHNDDALFAARAEARALRDAECSTARAESRVPRHSQGAPDHAEVRALHRTLSVGSR